MDPLDAFTKTELRFLRGLKTPAGIQRYLDEIPYHFGATSWSPRKVMQERTAHCLEGAIFAAAALRAIGRPPLVWDLEAVRDTDHVVAVYKERGHWGAIAMSNYASCRGREPIHKNLRELALTYFDGYFNPRGERTLRRYSRPMNLSRFDKRGWMTADKSVWFIAEALCDWPHTNLITRTVEKSLSRVDERTKQSGMVGHKKKA